MYYAESNPTVSQSKKFKGHELLTSYDLVALTLNLSKSCELQKLTFESLLIVSHIQNISRMWHLIKNKKRFFSIVVSLRFPVFRDFPDKICSQYENPFLHNST